MNVEKLFAGKGGYVFVSHSHLDIEKVRKIRNFLEAEGIEPILFYLRCMDGGDEQKIGSLKKLICDEIDAREFFLYINSENAAASAWVQEELAYIRSTRPSSVAVVDLSDADEITEEKLQQLLRGMRIFISASQYDREIVRRLTDALVKRDFRVYDTEQELSVGDRWLETASHTITKLAGEGFVIALLTRDSMSSPAFVRELKTAFAAGVPVLPITVGEPYFFVRELPELHRICTVPLSDLPTDEEIETVASSAVRMRQWIKDGWVQLKKEEE